LLRFFGSEGTLRFRLRNLLLPGLLTQDGFAGDWRGRWWIKWWITFRRVSRS
jgi:hypothetical protein